MKKTLYFILLAVEFFVGFLLLVLSSSLAGWPFFAVVTAVWAALMVWQVVKLKKLEKSKLNAKQKL